MTSKTVRQKREELPPAQYLYTPEVRRTEQSELGVRQRQLQRMHETEEERGRLIIVANRLPVSVGWDEGGKLTVKTSSGGLVSALAGVRNLNMVWIGWPGKVVPEEMQPEVRRVCREAKCVPVFLDKGTEELYYNGFANNVLWPLFHYLALPIEDSTNLEGAQWKAYQHANRLFTEAVLDVVEDGDAVWFHDYHLMLAPANLRAARPHLKIGWFLHTPFPSSEIYRSLSQREDILRGVLKADLVGFHTFDYARHFLNACTKVLGLDYTPYGVESDAHLTRVGTFPIGIDPKKFQDALETEEVRERKAKLERDFAGKTVCVGVDRLDMIKGIPQKLLAVERFLTDHPEWRSRFVLVQFAVPSRVDVPEYQRLRMHVHELVSRINGKFGTVGHMPIQYFDQSVPFPDMVALFAISDCALITSVRDGMNLVAYEYVMCQAERHGVLLLSEFAGAAQSLGAGALLMNPWNTEEVATLLEEALTMPPEEREERHSYCYNYVLRNTCQMWARNFVRELTDTRAEAEANEAKVPPPLDTAQLQASYRESKRRLIVLGFNGVLATPYNSKGRFKRRRWTGLAHAAAATIAGSHARQLSMDVPFRQVSKPVMDALEALAADPNNLLIIISAASREVLDSYFGGMNVMLAAENGMFFRAGGRGQEWVQMSETLELGWMESVERVFQYFAERTPGSIVERHETSMVWSYQAVHSNEFGRLQARDMLMHLCSGPLSTAPVDLLQGAKSVEVRPMGVSKGVMLNKVLLDLASLPVTRWSIHEADFCFCACFCLDRDEDLFTFVAGLADGGGAEEEALAMSGGSAMGDPVRRRRGTYGHAQSPLGPAPPARKPLTPPGLDVEGAAAAAVAVKHSTSTHSLSSLSTASTDHPVSMLPHLHMPALTSDKLFTCMVGRTRSAARYYVESAFAVRDLLREMAGMPAYDAPPVLE